MTAQVRLKAIFTGLVTVMAMGPLACVEATLTIRHQDPGTGAVTVVVDGVDRGAILPGESIMVSRAPGQCTINVTDTDHPTDEPRTMTLWVEGATDIDVMPPDTSSAP